MQRGWLAMRLDPACARLLRTLAQIFMRLDPAWFRLLRTPAHPALICVYVDPTAAGCIDMRLGMVPIWFRLLRTPAQTLH